MKGMKKAVAALVLSATIAASSVAYSQCSVCGSGYFWYCVTYVWGYPMFYGYHETDGSDPSFCNFGDFYCLVCSPVY